MKIGILGLGSIGTRHLNNLQKLGHEVAAYDPTECGPECRDEVISIADALVIATPTPQHYQDLIDCLAAGKPVFCEKPIAAERTQWRDLHNYLGTKEVMIGNNLRFHPGVVAAKDWAEARPAPLWASFTCAQLSTKPVYLRDGVILNWGAHEIDLALHLLGPAKVASAHARHTEHGDDIANIVLEHASGSLSTIHLDYVTNEEVREFRLVGDTNLHVNLLTRCMTPSITYTRWLGGSYDEDYLEEMRAFVDLAEGHGPMLGATGSDGLATLDIILEARKKVGLP